MSKPNLKLTKLACYSANFTMSSIFCVPPLLFVIFRDLFGISYTLLGTLVLVNFVSQLTIDLIFAVFSKHFNIRLTVILMPMITATGLFTYALIPTLFPDIAYLGLVIGTVIFSISAGLAEVLLSPIIAAIPSDNPQRDMSTLHSVYAFGACTMIVISTLFIKFFGADSWKYLIMLLACLPLIPATLFIVSPMPDMNGEGTNTVKHVRVRSKHRIVGLALCTVCIFFGSCSEIAMTNWISTYMENALGISKVYGDVFGAAMFAVLFGVARITYARFGKNICRTLLIGMAGTAVCYLVAGLSTSVVIAFIACIMTGFSTAMLWPGTLIMMEEKIPNVSVAAFALMAVGGDLGASISPQLLGIIVDKVSVTEFALKTGASLNVSPEQIGLKVGMLVTALFPIIGIGIVIAIMRYFKKHSI